MRGMTWRWAIGGLAVLGLLVACGDDDDSGGGSADEADQAEQAEQEPATTTTAAPTTTTTVPATTTTAVPHVVYEVDGTGTVIVNYTASGDRMQNLEVTLPWSEDQAEEPSRLSMLVALTGSQGDVTCRIRRGDEILAEATLAGTAGPLLSCDYPPSGLPPVTFP